MRIQITPKCSIAILARHFHSCGCCTYWREYKVNIIIYYECYLGGLWLAISKMNHVEGRFKDESCGRTVQTAFPLHKLYNEQMQSLF